MCQRGILIIGTWCEDCTNHRSILSSSVRWWHLSEGGIPTLRCSTFRGPMMIMFDWSYRNIVTNSLFYKRLILLLSRRDDCCFCVVSMATVHQSRCFDSQEMHFGWSFVVARCEGKVDPHWSWMENMFLHLGKIMRNRLWKVVREKANSWLATFVC